MSDSPIKNKDSDRLNRASMARHVARLVNDFESKESFVVGIEGEWGSGKTSFINFIAEDIDPQKAEIIFFNPWNFSSQDQLIEDFFDTLLSTVEKIQPEGKLGDTIKKYKRKLKNIDFNPSIMGVSLGSIGIEGPSLNSLRSELENELEKLNKKIMIVIDDIDRLDTKETLAVFKLVKVTANFSNCIFFLSYDRKRVVERIDEDTNGAGDDYIKKIIQTTFRLPLISRKQLKEMVFEQIDQVLADLFGEIKLNEEDTKRWSSINYNNFTDLFQNIRDLKRYASSLRLNLGVIGKHEINIVDFITLEAIRVFAPNFYDEIPKNRWLFTNSMYGLTFNDSSRDKRTENYKKIIEENLEKNSQKEIIIAITKELFPLIDNYGMYGDGWEEQWSGNKQVCSDSKFEAYFQLSVSPDEISEEEFEGMMEQMANQKFRKVLGVIKEINSDNKLKNFLKKVHDRFEANYETKPNFFHNISDTLFSIFDKLPIDTEGFLDFDGVDRQLERLIWRLSEKISGEKNKYDFLKNTLSRSTLLYPKVELIRILKRNKTGQATHLAEIKNVLDKTANDLLLILQKLLDEDTLKKEYRADRIIWVYKEWGKETEIKEYFKKLAEDKKDIFVIFQWLRSRVNSSTRGLYYRIDKTTLAEFVDIAIIDKTVSKIKPDKLKGDEKALYDLYERADKDEW